MKKTLCSAAIMAGVSLAATAPAAAHDTPPVPEPPPPTPAAAPAAPAAPAPVPPYTVGRGDSLSAISAARLGTSDRWVEIFALNRQAIADPNQIEVGQVLQIPSGPVPVPADLLAGLVPSQPAAPSSPRPPVRSTRAAARTAPAPRAGGSLAAIRACESGGDYGAVSANGRYRGAYQFDSRTWASVGGTGDPAAASPAEQDARARQLQAQRGSSPWPTCG